MSGRTPNVLSDGRFVVGYRKTLIQRKSKRRKWNAVPPWTVSGNLPFSMPFLCLPKGPIEGVVGLRIKDHNVISAEGHVKDWCLQQIMAFIREVEPTWYGRLHLHCDRPEVKAEQLPREHQHYVLQFHSDGTIYYGRNQPSRRFVM